MLQNFAIALLLRAFHALNQNILTDNLFDPDLIRGSLAMPADKQANVATNLWFVYILRCADNSLYTGITTDVERRLREHNDPAGHSHLGKYTHKNGPWQLLGSEAHQSRSVAMRREIQLKSWKSPAKVRQLFE